MIWDSEIHQNVTLIIWEGGSKFYVAITEATQVGMVVLSSFLIVNDFIELSTSTSSKWEPSARK